MPFTRDDLLELPFVHVGKTVDYWAVTACEDYAEDCATGRMFASMLVSFMRDHDAPTIMNWVLDAMPNGDDRCGLEIGFVQELAERAVAASRKATPLADLDRLVSDHEPPEPISVTGKLHGISFKPIGVVVGREVTKVSVPG